MEGKGRKGRGEESQEGRMVNPETNGKNPETNDAGTYSGWVGVKWKEWRSGLRVEELRGY